MTRLPVGVLLLLSALPAGAADLTVRLENADGTAGQFVVALFDSKEDYMDRPVREARAEIRPDGTGELLFADLAAGTYAISTYHDRNGNDKLDTNFVGVPKEPYAFSNNAGGRFGPPKFDAAAFEIGTDDLTLAIRFPE